MNVPVEAVAPAPDTLYIKLMRELFKRKLGRGKERFDWARADLTEIASDLGVKAPKNLGDNVYSVRYRKDLPEDIRAMAPAGKTWILLPNGKSSYTFAAADTCFLDPDRAKLPIKIPDSTPQLVARYAKRDEQAVLARIRYCRLVDIFMGIASYQLQSHMRTTVLHFNKAQTELDEIYVGVDATGAQMVITIQAKGNDERIGAVQIVTDHYTCKEKFPQMVSRIVAAQTVKIEDITGFGESFTIAMIEAVVVGNHDVKKLREEHFQLVPASMISDADLQAYNTRFGARPRSR